MTLCSNCRHPTFQPRVDISSDAINAKLRSEFGSSSYTSQNISDILLLCDRDIDDYEVEVARLRSQILYIQTQQGRLKHHKQNLRSLLSPSRWIPNEILSYIFELACDRNLLQDFPHSSPPTKLTSPIITYLPAMSMSMVSARWRMLSLSLPGLWSQLKLEIALPKTSQKFISMLKLFLERSRDHPLQLQLDISGDTIDTQHLHLDMLARNAQRWKTLCVGGDLMIRHIPEFSQLHLPNLEDLDIDYREEPVSEEDIACFQWAPKLRSLTAYAVVAPTSTVWQRLTDAHILAYSGQAEKILEECPNISNLKLSENRYDACHPCILPRTSYTVTSLSIDIKMAVGMAAITSTGLLATLLSSLTLPSLRELRVSTLDVHYRRAWPKRTFRDFIGRSSCKLEILSMDCIDLSDEDLLDYLQLLPSLRNLSINDNVTVKGRSPITSRFISSLHSYSESSLSLGPLLPNLRCLFLGFSGVDFDDDSFIRMVSTRWLSDPEYAAIVGVSSLREVVLRFRARTVDAKVYQPLLDLDRMGLRVVVHGLK